MFNYFIFKEIIRFLRRNFKFIFVLLLFIIFLIFNNKVSFGYSFAGHTIAEPPQQVLNYLYSTSEYNDNQHHYFIFGYNGYHICFFPKSDNFKGYFYLNGSQVRFRFNQGFVYKQYNLSTSYTLVNITNDTVTINNTWGLGFNADNSFYWSSNFNMYDNSNYSGTPIYNVFTNPFIVTQSNNIVNWSFSDFIINCGSYNPNADFYLRYTYPDNNTIYELDLQSYKTIENNTAIISVPRSVLTSDIVVRNGSRITFTLIIREQIEGGSTVDTFDFGGYTLNLSEQQQTEINEDSNKQLLSDISQQQQQTTQAIEDLNNSQQETTEAIDNLDDTITDSSVDNSSIFLPSDNTSDITSEGLNGIFTTIYNAFCVGRPIDIVFPFPFTNKSFTIHANYLYDMLTNNNADWVINIIRLYWWYIISKFIIIDISKKITKIKSGDIEDIENDNIKEEML